MAQSSFSTQAPHGPRKPFQAGDIFGNQPRRDPYVLVAPPHSDMLSNTPFAAKWGSARQNANAFGFVEGTSGHRMEMQKTPLPRDSGRTGRKGNGTYGY
jgi:hypothetical protein